MGALLTGLAWGQGRSGPQLSLEVAKKSWPSARVLGGDRGCLASVLQGWGCGDSDQLGPRMPLVRGD